jgi:hypothetical protein
MVLIVQFRWILNVNHFTYWICNSAAVDLLNYGLLSAVNWTQLKAVVFGQLHVVLRNGEKNFVFSDDSVFQTWSKNIFFMTSYRPCVCDHIWCSLTICHPEPVSLLIFDCYSFYTLCMFKLIPLLLCWVDFGCNKQHIRVCAFVIGYLLVLLLPLST